MLALITGASAGIGEEFARQLAAKHWDLVLVARRRERLEQLASELTERHAIKTFVLPADLSDPAECRALYERVREFELSIDLLVNNAGFGVVGATQDAPLEREEAMIRLNVCALHTLTRLFLADMRAKSSRTSIINVASTAAFQPVPYMNTYAATKAFVLSFTEGLAAELRGSRTEVMALCPGITRTEFGSVAGLRETRGKSVMTPQEVVAHALRALSERRVVAIPGGLNAALSVASRFTPRPIMRRSLARVMKKITKPTGGSE